MFYSKFLHIVNKLPEPNYMHLAVINFFFPYYICSEPDTDWDMWLIIYIVAGIFGLILLTVLLSTVAAAQRKKKRRRSSIEVGDRKPRREAPVERPPEKLEEHRDSIESQYDDPFFI